MRHEVANAKSTVKKQRRAVDNLLSGALQLSSTLHPTRPQARDAASRPEDLADSTSGVSACLVAFAKQAPVDSSAELLEFFHGLNANSFNRDEAFSLHIDINYCLI